MNGPPIFVSTGTLVPDTPKIKLPRWLTAPLYLPHLLGLTPNPDRFFADGAYGPLKRLGGCWVVTLSWLGLDKREASIEIAKAKLRQLLAKYPGRKVILVGQSQGGLIVLELAMDPEFEGCIAAVVLAGVPLKGSDHWLAKVGSRVFQGVREMRPEHDSLQELGVRVATNFPTDVVVVLAASPNDEMVSIESALGVSFPDGTDIRRFIIDEQQPDDLEEGVTFLHCGRRAKHVLMCRGDLVPVIRELRVELTITEELQAA